MEERESEKMEECEKRMEEREKRMEEREKRMEEREKKEKGETDEAGKPEMPERGWEKEKMMKKVCHGNKCD